MGNQIPCLWSRLTPNQSSSGFNRTKFEGLFIIEYLQLNKFKEKPMFDPYIRVPVFLRWAVHHVSMYFLGKAAFLFLPDEKRSGFLEKNTIFADKTKKIKCPYGAFWNNYLFWGSE